MARTGCLCCMCPDRSLARHVEQTIPPSLDSIMVAAPTAAACCYLLLLLYSSSSSYDLCYRCHWEDDDFYHYGKLINSDKPCNDVLQSRMHPPLSCTKDMVIRNSHFLGSCLSQLSCPLRIHRVSISVVKKVCS